MIKLTPDSILTWISNLPFLSLSVEKSPKGVMAITVLSAEVVPEIVNFEVETMELSDGSFIVIFEPVAVVSVEEESLEVFSDFDSGFSARVGMGVGWPWEEGLELFLRAK